MINNIRLDIISYNLIVDSMALTFTFIENFFWGIIAMSPLLLLLLIITVFIGQIVGHMEKWKKFDALYWSLITATTVGYGDIRPLKRTSKLLSIFIAFIGIMLTGIIVAITLYTAKIAFDKHNNQDLKIIQENTTR